MDDICPPPRLWHSDLLSRLPGIVHGVSERTGGQSAPPYASLNLGLHVGDSADRVRENRRRLARSAGSALSRMICGEQIHGAAVAIVTAADAGRGAEDIQSAIPGVDALVTNTPDLLLTLFFADCLPVLLADPARRAVAVAHAGWRGMVGGVIENSAQAMREAFGSRLEEIVAAVGPGIGPCCFEVGEEVAARFDAAMVVRSSASGKPRIDLALEAYRRLHTLGIPHEHIDICRDCTACNTDRFFSHRRESGRTGRMAGFIGLRPA